MNRIMPLFRRNKVSMWTFVGIFSILLISGIFLAFLYMSRAEKGHDPQLLVDKALYEWRQDVREKPRNSDRGETVEKYQKYANGSTGYAWCAAFVSYVLHEAYPKYGYKSASPEGLQSHLQDIGTFHSWGGPEKDTKRPIPGDIMIYQWTNKDGSTGHHAGIVVDFDGKGDMVTTVDGNTTCVDDDKNQCVTKSRWSMNVKKNNWFLPKLLGWGLPYKLH